MQSLKIITIGSGTLDLFFQSSQLPISKDGQRLSLAFGGKYVAQKFAESIGGGGCNVGVGLARQGYQVAYWGKIGHDWAGQRVRQKLTLEKVQKDLIQDANQTYISAILLSDRGERTIVSFRAQNDDLDFNQSVNQAFTKTDWLYQANLPLCPVEKRLDWLAFARKNKVKTCITLSGNEYKKGLAYVKKFIDLSDIFILNAHELADIWGKNAPDLDLPKTNFAQELGAAILIVTADVKGSFGYTPKNIYYQPIIKTQVVDTTGAGDAYAAGFLGRFLQTETLPPAMAFGAKNAASVISFLTCQKGLLAG